MADLTLPRGKQMILQADDDKYKRGLLVTLLDEGGYEMAYWYDKPEVYPIEVLVDGKSIKKDAKVVTMKFHPELKEEWSNDYKKKIDCNNPKGFSQKAHCDGRKKRQAGQDTKSQPVKEDVNKQKLEERMELFLEKNVPTSPSKWAYWVGQAKKKFDVYPSAYANGWAAKMYKDAGGKWKKEKKK